MTEAPLLSEEARISPMIEEKRSTRDTSTDRVRGQGNRRGDQQKLLRNDTLSFLSRVPNNGYRNVVSKIFHQLLNRIRVSKIRSLAFIRTNKTLTNAWTHRGSLCVLHVSFHFVNPFETRERERLFDAYHPPLPILLLQRIYLISGIARRAN